MSLNININDKVAEKIAEITGKFVGSIVKIVLEVGLSYLLYNYFIAVQLHLPTGTLLQVLAACILRNLIFVPLITTAQTLFTKK
jgi:hypothetical protein